MFVKLGTRILGERKHGGVMYSRADFCTDEHAHRGQVVGDMGHGDGGGKAVESEEVKVPSISFYSQHITICRRHRDRQKRCRCQKILLFL